MSDLSTKRIAIADDDQNILALVSMALRREGFDVDMYSDGDSALRGLKQKPPDLAILDIKMPRRDGLDVLAKLNGSIPVIFLTSKDQESDEALGLSLGADDYMTKPFSMRLLIERVRAVLRRRYPEQSAPSAALVRGQLTLDSDMMMCQWKGCDVRLTVTEFLILNALAIRPNIICTRDQLMDVAYGKNFYIEDRSIDSHIKRIRYKFKAVDLNFNGIETVYGLGYRYIIRDVI